jgi:iron complex outermembrane receptor protein
VQPRLTAHVSVARGVETPTLGELSYRVDGTGGFNTDLQAQKSSQFEAGVKWQSDSGQAAVEATLFHIQVSDEIGVATNAGGRQSFRNVGRTQRQGFEIGANWSPLPGWRGLASVTLLDATYRDGFLACTGIPCTAASVPVAAGNRIAGTQKGMAYAEVAWSPVNHLNVALEVRAASALMANDTNTEAAPRYAVWALRALHRIPLGDGYRLELLGRIDNLTDKRHAGTVIVNDANGRFYEPGAPRSFLLSLRATKQF